MVHEIRNDLISGSIAGIAGRLIEHPFDTVKVRLQTTDKFTSSFNCLKSTISKEGFQGLYSGLSIPLACSVFESAAQFAIYHAVLPYNASIYEKCFAGAVSGFAISFILTPVELVKCNLQIQTLSGKPVYSGPIEFISATLKNTGINGFYKGHTGTMLRESIGSAAWFGSFESTAAAFIQYRQKLTNNIITKDDLSTPELMVSGAAAGMSFNAAFFPADVIKSRAQTLYTLENRSVGFFECAQELYRLDGIKGFFRGFTMTVLRSAPTSAAIFTVYELVHRRLPR